MDFWRNDLRHALRVMARAPGFTAAALVSLIIGIGATTAIFSIANGVLLRPLPYADADRIAILWQRSPGLNVAQDWLSIGQYLDIANENSVFERTAAAISASFNMTGEAQPERVDGVRVTSSFFSLFGAQAALGRVFDSTEDRPGAPAAVILANGFWQRRFGGDSGVIGRTLTLNGTPMAVVGVLADSFTFDHEVMPAVNGIQRADVLLPLPLAASARSRRTGEDYNVFAKLKRETTVGQAQAQMNTIAGRMKTQYPAFYPPGGGLTISVVPLLTQVVGDVRLAVYVLIGAVGLLLLIACGNVANLLLSRAAIRGKEMAIRAAVGARHTRLLRLLFSEQLLLALAGGVGGAGFASFAIAGLRRFGPANIPRLAEIRVDWRVLAFTGVISVLTPLVFGLVPALRTAGVDPADVLKEGGRGGVGTRAFGMSQARLSKLLIAAEVALSLVLLVGAGLLVRSYARVEGANPGFDPHNVLSLRLSLPGARYGKPGAVQQFYDQLEQRLEALPGVAFVGTNYQLPLSSVALAWEPIGVEGYVPPDPGKDLIITSSAYVSPDYFRTMRIPLQRGRFFNMQDDRESPPVVIVDNRLAARFWPNENPLGKRLRQGTTGPWRTVVGVVTNTTEYSAAPQPPITAYFPVRQYGIASQFVVIRTADPVDPATLVPAVTREIHSMDPDLPAYDVATMERRFDDSLARRRLSMILLVTFAGFALLLSGIGTYSVVGYWVDQRRRDIGIRRALGADPRRVVGLIAREFLAVVGIGLVLGLLGAFALTRIMAGLLFGVAATDMATFSVTPVVIAAIAVVATYVPARRALRVEPMTELRRE